MCPSIAHVNGQCGPVVQLSGVDQCFLVGHFIIVSFYIVN